MKGQHTKKTIEMSRSIATDENQMIKNNGIRKNKKQKQQNGNKVKCGF